MAGANGIRRSFLQGALRMYVLSCASREPTYGGALTRALEDFGHEVSPGTLYPLLREMEEKGLVESFHHIHNGRLRKYYRITDQGRCCLDASRTAVEGMVRQIFSER